jgi:hypothetical protein
VVIAGNTATVPGSNITFTVPSGTPPGTYIGCNNGNGSGTISGPLVPGGSCTGPVPTSSNQTVFFTAVISCFSPSAAAPLTQSADAARTAAQVGLNVIQSQVQSIRDDIRNRMRRGQAGRPLGFAAPLDNDAIAAADDLPWSVSSYTGRNARSPVLKAPPKAPADALSIKYSTWAVGFYDNERRDETVAGVDVGRRTATTGGIGGAYAIISGLNLPFSQPNDVIVLSAFGGETTSSLHNNIGTSTRVTGPGLGLTAIWMRGGFSADSTFKVDFFSISPSTLAPTQLQMTAYNSITNLNYRIDLGTWWAEPTGGVGYTDTQWDSATQALGFVNGHQVRLTGGSRFGTSWNWNGVRVDPVVGLFVYDDVVVKGGTFVTAVANPLVRTDEGKLFGQATGKLGFDWGRGLSSYIEGEVRGREGVLGVASRLGLTYAWN